MLRRPRSSRRQLRRVLRRGGRRVVADRQGAVLGTLALSYELGEAWTVQTEPKNAADAAALAGATQLDRKGCAIQRARQVAISELSPNSQTFAPDGGGADVVIPAGRVTVYATLADARAKTNALADDQWALANFTRVESGQRSVGFSFARLVGGPSAADSDGHAIAGTGSIYCKVPPMFFCMPSDPALLAEGNGVWMKGKDNGSSNAWAPGNFGLLALNQIDGSASLSASEIIEAMARVNPLAQCYSADGTVQTKPGETTSITLGVNMRFDIYANSNQQLPNGELAVEDNPQYRPSVNTVKGLSRAGTQCSLKKNGWEIPDDPPDGPGEHADLTANPVGAMCYPRDNCAYPLTGNNPDGDTCVPSSGEGRFSDGSWDRSAYFRVNHPSTPAAMAIGAADLDGDGKTTRYETFIWEIENALIPHRPPTTTTTGDELGNTTDQAVCHADPTSYDPNELDRRVLTVAVLDCSGLSGTTTATPLGYYNIFLTEPVGGLGSPPDNKSIYAEIIGPANDPGFKAKVARTTIQLYE